MPATKATKATTKAAGTAKAAPRKVAPAKVTAAKAVPKKATPAKSAPRFPAAVQVPSGYTLGRQKTQGSATEDLFDLEVPSGATCQVRRPGPQGLIKAGILDSLDQLTSLVQVEHFDKHDPAANKKAVSDFASDMKQVMSGFALIDKLCCYIVVQPELYLPADYAEDGEHAGKEPPTEAISVDDVELVDRLYILQWAVGGVNDLAAFRQEFGQLLGDLSVLQNLSL